MALASGEHPFSPSSAGGSGGASLPTAAISTADTRMCRGCVCVEIVSSMVSSVEVPYSLDALTRLTHVVTNLCRGGVEVMSSLCVEVSRPCVEHGVEVCRGQPGLS